MHVNYVNSSEMTKVVNINGALESFIRGDNVIAVPFELAVNDQFYLCSDVLRLLPGKRLVVIAANGDKQLVIKLFVNAKKGVRELKREQDGFKRATKADINLPALQFIQQDLAGCSAVAYEYLKNGKPFSDNQATVARYSDELLNLVSALHNAGIYQDDFHLDNVLIANDQLFLIDMASVNVEEEDKSLSKHKSLTNLAKLIVQFKPKQQITFVNRLKQYYQAREWSWDDREQERFIHYLDSAWHKRKNLYLKKCFRACTMTAYRKNFQQQYAFHRSFLDDVGQDFITNIEQLVQQGHLLKDGNSATVVSVNYAGKSLVIKRYNIKSFWHFLKRCFRQSRAAISWRNGNLLELMGIATPKPLGFIEQRFGWLRKTAYLICEQTVGEELYSVYSKREPNDGELEQLNDLFLLLQNYQISHGDLKASNLLLDENGVISLIDLDAMQEHHSDSTFQRAFSKDKKRFMKNWQNSGVKVMFQTIFR